VAPAGFEYKDATAILNTGDYEWTLTLKKYKIAFTAVDNPFVFALCFKEISKSSCRSISFDENGRARTGKKPNFSILVPKEKRYMFARVEQQQVYVYGVRFSAFYVVYDYFADFSSIDDVLEKQLNLLFDSSGNLNENFKKE